MHTRHVVADKEHLGGGTVKVSGAEVVVCLGMIGLTMGATENDDRT